MRSPNSDEIDRKHRSRSLVMLAAVTLISVVFLARQVSALSPSLLFQTPLPTPEEPEEEEVDVDPNWITAATGGSIQGPAFKVVFPAGFTTQGGATVYVDRLLPPIQVQGQPLVSGTQLAIGIWPPNDQTTFDTPITVAVTLDPAQAASKGRSFEFRMFDPVKKRWVALPSTLNRATAEISTSIRTFTPVPRDFPSWGGRTLMGVFTAGPAPTPTAPLALPTQSSPLCLVASNGLNLRTGPGTTYVPVISLLSRGTRLVPLGRSRDGGWLRVRVETTRREGWVKTGQAYLLCNVTSSSLRIVPGPTPSPARP